MRFSTKTSTRLKTELSFFRRASFPKLAASLRFPGRGRSRGSVNAEFAAILVVICILSLLGINIVMSGLSSLYVYLVTYDAAIKISKATSQNQTTNIASSATANLKTEPLAKLFHTTVDFPGGGISVYYPSVKAAEPKRDDLVNAPIRLCAVKTKCQIEPLVDIPLASLAGIPFVSRNTVVEYKVEALVEHPERIE